MNAKLLLLGFEQTEHRNLNRDLKEYTLDFASTFSEAKSKLEEDSNIYFIISNTTLPDIPIEEAIAEFISIRPSLIILLRSSESDIQEILKYIKKGAYDFIQMDAPGEKLKFKVENGLEVFNLRQVKKSIEEEKDKRLKEELNWVQWKQKAVKQNISQNTNTFIESIRNSFSQGPGFGTLISVIKMLDMVKVKKDSVYEIEEGLFDLLIENTVLAEKALMTFEEISNLTNDDPVLTPMTISDLYNILKDRLEELERYIKIKNHKVELESYRNEFLNIRILANTDLMITMIDELILNALKFSIPGTGIYILISYSNSELVFSILNSSKENISQHSEFLFQPFIRSNKFIYDGYNTLDYGLGLCLVSLIVNAHNANIRISDVKNHLSKYGDNEMVHVEIVIPLINK